MQINFCELMGKNYNPKLPTPCCNCTFKLRFVKGLRRDVYPREYEMWRSLIDEGMTNRAILLDNGVGFTQQIYSTIANIQVLQPSL